MAAIEITVDDREVKKLIKSLNKDQRQTALVRSINRALGGIQTDTNKSVRKELNVTTRTVKETFKLKKANKGDISASLKSTGKPINFYDKKTGKLNFSGRQTKKGMAFTIKKGRGRQKFKSAFVATMPTGFRGVFVRKIGQRKIKALHTTRVPDILDNQETIDKVLENAGERFIKNLNQQVEYLLNG